MHPEEDPQILEILKAAIVKSDSFNRWLRIN
jgi:hypothetical protein